MKILALNSPAVAKSKIADTSSAYVPSKIDTYCTAGMRRVPAELSKVYFCGKISKVDEIDARTAIAAYNSLKYQDKLECSRDGVITPLNKKNLEFLDKLKSPVEQKKFIKYYQSFTGFPDYNGISARMIREAQKSLKSAEKLTSLNCGEDDSRLLWSGYNMTCSVGRGYALPGSDIDGWNVIIKGTGDLKKDNELTKSFRKNIFKAADLRFVSLHHIYSAPGVYTLGQLADRVQRIQHKIDTAIVSIKDIESHSVQMSETTELLDDLKNYIVKNGGNKQEVRLKDYITHRAEHFKAQIGKKEDVLLKAAEFNHILSKFFPEAVGAEEVGLEMTKADLKSITYPVEVLRTSDDLKKRDLKNFVHKGIIVENLTPEEKQVFDSIRKTDFYKFTNLTQMTARINLTEQDAQHIKGKLKERIRLKEGFDSMGTGEQYRYVRGMVRYMADILTDLPEMFGNTQLFESESDKLIKALTKARF